MTYRTLAAAALCVALAAPAFADSYSTHCFGRHSRASGNWSTCTTDIKRDPPPEPRVIYRGPPQRAYDLPPTVERDSRTGITVVRGGNGWLPAK